MTGRSSAGRVTSGASFAISISLLILRPTPIVDFSLRLDRPPLPSANRVVHPTSPRGDIRLVSPSHDPYHYYQIIGRLIEGQSAHAGGPLTSKPTRTDT